MTLTADERQMLHAVCQRTRDMNLHRAYFRVDEVEALLNDLGAAEASIARLEEALRQYADFTNWMRRGRDEYIWFAVDGEAWDIARAALNDIGTPASDAQAPDTSAEPVPATQTPPPSGREAGRLVLPRNLVYRFWELASSQRRSIIMGLGLLDDAAIALPEAQRYSKAITTIGRLGLVQELAEAVAENENDSPSGETATVDSSPESPDSGVGPSTAGDNPFAVKVSMFHDSQDKTWFIASCHMYGMDAQAITMEALVGEYARMWIGQMMACKQEGIDDPFTPLLRDDDVRAAAERRAKERVGC